MNKFKPGFSSDPMEEIKKHLRSKIDFIINGRDITPKVKNKVITILNPSATVSSHNMFKFGKGKIYTGICGHATRKTVRAELTKYMREYLNELQELSSNDTSAQTNK